MSELKPGWRRVKFGEVVQLNRETCKEPAAEGIERYIGLEHIEPGEIRVRSWGDVSDGTTFTNRVRPGQVLFGKRRAYQRKVAVADFDAICSGDIYVFESADPSRLLPEILPFICQTDAFFDHAVGTSAGSLSPRTNWSSLADYELALPPAEEQLPVIKMLRAASASVERVRAAQEAAEQAYRVASSVLFTRKLPTKGVGPEHWAPLAWDLPQLEGLVEPDAPISYGIVQVGDSVAGGVPTVTSNNLNIGFRKGIHYTSPVIEASYVRSRIRGKDILVTVKGFGTGNIGIVPDFFAGNINRDVARIRIPDVEDARFFVHLWRSPSFDRFWHTVSVGTTRPELSIGKLRAMRIPWPLRDVRECVARDLDMLERASVTLADRHVHAQAMLGSLIRRTLPVLRNGAS